MSRPVRTRYAPSPTGYQHIGGIRTALYCYLFTRQNNGTFVLRIEDTDRSRYMAEAENYIIESLKWCGLECDEGVHVGGDYGPYRQSERKDMYRQYVDQLVTDGHAYYAFDTKEEIEAMRENLKTPENPFPMYGAATREQMKNSLSLSQAETQALLDADTPYVIRIKIPNDQTITVHDLVRGEVNFQTKEMDDKVLLKADGMPTYHMANVIDDHLMEITDVIRGEEWLSSTPLHVWLYRCLGWEDTMPTFSHLPLILKPTGKGKLGKRDGAKFGFPVFPLQAAEYAGFREMGFIPDAFVNFLAFLGWNPGTEQELFSQEELIKAFTIEKVSKSGARFDFEKAKWFNEQYIQAMSDADLAALVMQQAPDHRKETPIDFVTKACSMMKTRITFIKDFWEKGYYFFDLPAEYDRKVVRKKWKEDRPEKFDELKNRLCSLPDFTAQAIETEVKAFMSDHSLGFGDVLQVFRVMLAGTMSGPPIFEMAALLGQDEVASRMDLGAIKFDEMKNATA